MLATETTPSSHLVAVRKVVLPNEELERFYDQVTVDARETLGYRGTQTVRLPETLSVQLDPGYRARYEDVGKLNADVFSLRSLRVVLFSRRAAASQQVNQLLQNAYVRLAGSEFYAGRTRRTMTGQRRPVGLPNLIPSELTQIQLDNGFTNGSLALTASSVENISPTGATEQHYALKIDAGTAAAQVLLVQHAAIETAASRIQATKGLARDDRFAHDVDPLAVTIMRLPGGLSRETARFEEVVNLHEAVNFELGPVEWRLKIAASEE